MPDRMQIRALDDLAHEFRAAAARESRRRSRRRVRHPLALAALLSVSLAASAAGASLFLDRGDPIPPAPAGDFSADQQPLPGTAALTGVQTADPDGGPPWGVRVHRNAAGDPCFTVGQIVDGKFGAVANGTFRELPLRGPGSCVTLTGRERPLGMTEKRFVGPGELPRTAIFGVAGPLVDGITLISGDERKTLTPGEAGAYLAVFDGYPTVTRIVHFTDGTRDVLTP